MDSVIPGLVGAVAGGLITQTGNLLFHKFKERTPQIVFKEETNSVFKPFEIQGKEAPFIVLNSKDGAPQQFKNLFLTTVHLRNTSAQHFPEFAFVLTCPQGFEFISLTEVTPGDHHLVEKTQIPDVAKPEKKIELKLKPFNRKDEYIINAYLTATSEFDDIPKVNRDSSLPIKFIEPPKADEKKIGQSVTSILLIINTLFMSLFMAYYYMDKAALSNKADRLLEAVTDGKAKYIEALENHTHILDSLRKVNASEFLRVYDINMKKEIGRIVLIMQKHWIL